ncbi:glycosyltransferase family 9 protein [Bdellovibrio sp. KM01]|uniref:glycosyltransferase family 9 protein n=1 Tax=Bdellovibrio sp. KM01 TaxID=2748865 RepID=UPI0015E9152D|nr:glycosyltransferase family 9 protein [Bdellovibrio sp. KM01]QLY25976.1 glycosyltransferase family 9 protein [Bdellovibrio sp. KM01]
MKILIQQLARLGDIYMSWPAVRAVRRMYPDAEIHFLTRPRFEGAVEGLTAIDKHLTLPSGHILMPLVNENVNLEESLNRMEEFVEQVRAENYDQIINLTFSPFSSYLTHALTMPHTTVLGYTRFRDGFFCAADEVSAYFYAQVGINKPNRVHIADIFASMIGTEYTEQDWEAPEMPELNFDLPQLYLTVHVGASEKHKALTPDAWGRAIDYFNRRYQGMPIVLIGAPNEVEIANEIIAAAPNAAITNLVGKTRMNELFTVLKRSELLIGCDSAPIHMASLTDTPTLNISIGNVNFWETGPKATLGLIYRVEEGQDVAPERIGEIIAQLLEGNADPELIMRTGGLASYTKVESAEKEFAWNLVQALYLGGQFPVAERIEIIEGAMKLDEINDFMMSQFALIHEKGVEAVAPFIDGGEDVIKSISRIVPELRPMIDWYHAEKIRVAPGTQEEIVAATLSVHERFKRHLRVYVPRDEKVTTVEAKDGTL